MNEQKIETITKIIQEVVAMVIERESNRQALISVTRVELRERRKKAVIFVSVLPDSQEETVLHFLKRKRAILREALKENARIHPLPFLDVEIDKGEKARHTIDALLKKSDVI